jgi:hypothetical protein
MDEYYPIHSPFGMHSTSEYDPGMILVFFGYIAILWFLICRTPNDQPQHLFPPRIGH